MKIYPCLSCFYLFINYQVLSFHSSTHGIFLFLPLSFLTAISYFLCATFEAFYDVKALIFWKLKSLIWLSSLDMAPYLSVKSSGIASAIHILFQKVTPYQLLNFINMPVLCQCILLPCYCFDICVAYNVQGFNFCFIIGRIYQYFPVLYLKYIFKYGF